MLYYALNLNFVAIQVFFLNIKTAFYIYPTLNTHFTKLFDVPHYTLPIAFLKSLSETCITLYVTITVFDIKRVKKGGRGINKFELFSSPCHRQLLVQIGRFLKTFFPETAKPNESKLSRKHPL
jgi:hypothetical protein